MIFYDTTSLHFEVDEEDEGELGKRQRRYPPQRKRGHSKNGRDDAPQIVIGLAITRDGPNVLDKLQTIKVVEYERGGVRVCQTTEPRPDVRQLLARFNIPMPPKLHDVRSQPNSRPFPIKPPVAAAPNPAGDA